MRASDQVKVIQTNVRTPKISLYTDDILVFTKDQSEPIPALIKMIDELSSFYGYNI